MGGMLHSPSCSHARPCACLPSCSYSRWKTRGILHRHSGAVARRDVAELLDLAENDYSDADKAIVMRPVTSVKSSPAAGSSTDLFILHEGTKVKVIDEVGSWNNIELADGRRGWIPSADIERI